VIAIGRGLLNRLMGLQLFGRAQSTEEFFLLLSFVVGQLHAVRVVPLVALITFDVEQVRVQRLAACAERLPLAEWRLQYLLQRVIVRSSKVRKVIDVVQVVVFLNCVNLALPGDAVDVNLVVMIRGEDFIVSNVDHVGLLNCELLHIQVHLLVVPLDFNHGPFGVELVAALRYDPDELAHHVGSLSLAEQNSVAHLVNGLAEAYLPVLLLLRLASFNYSMIIITQHLLIPGATTVACDRWKSVFCFEIPLVILSISDTDYI
jgi:hypothetical protein